MEENKEDGTTIEKKTGKKEGDEGSEKERE